MALLDVRRKADYQANQNTIKGALWRDPEKIGDWVKQRQAGKRIVVYCVKGGSVSQSVTDRLRGEGFDAVFLESGLKNVDAVGKVPRPNLFRQPARGHPRALPPDTPAS